MSNSSSLRKTPFDLIRELNERRKSNIIGTPLDLLRELNRRKSNKIETPLDLLRILNKERRKRKIRDKLLHRLEGSSLVNLLILVVALINVLFRIMSTI